MSDRRRYVVIGLAAALMAAGVFVGGEILRQATVPGAAVPPAKAETEILVRQQGQFRTLGKPIRAAGRGELPGGAPSLAERKTRRAFPGAPPSVPHPLAAEMVTGGACLTCHGQGGWTPRFEAYAPVTPHPELTSCLQCHVAKNTEGSFRRNDFRAAAAPSVDSAAFPGAPPSLPHELRMRERCDTCHVGPAAPPELRTSHPERVGCLQCHAPQEPGAAPAWIRGGPS